MVESWILFSEMGDFSFYNFTKGVMRLRLLEEIRYFKIKSLELTISVTPF